MRDQQILPLLQEGPTNRQLAEASQPDTLRRDFVVMLSMLSLLVAGSLVPFRVSAIAMAPPGASTVGL